MTTEAGRALAAKFIEYRGEVEQAIAAIEAEAAGEPERCPDRCGGRVGHPGYHQSSDHAAIVREAAAVKPATPEAVLRAIRAEFLRFLTVDGPTRDRRRRDFNQAIFDAEGGWAVFNGTDLGMVMEKFDKALAALGKPLP